MSILAAKCPCCGRDIGFDENTQEYTCVFCGTRLHVSALKAQPVEPLNGAAKEAEKPAEPEKPREVVKPKPQKVKKDPSQLVHGVDPEEVGMTREEIEEQLTRKAEFKEELHSVAHQIDELRARRPKLEAQKKTVATLSGVGIGLAILAAIGIALFADGDAAYSDTIVVISAIIALVALAMLIVMVIRRHDLKKQRSRLEETILEKKQKRDILIGRLNKINKQLHIHSHK